MVDTGTIVARDLGWQPFARSLATSARVRSGERRRGCARPSLRCTLMPSTPRSAAPRRWPRCSTVTVPISSSSTPSVRSSRTAAVQRAHRACPTPTAGSSTGSSPAPRGRQAGDIVGGDGVGQLGERACVGAGGFPSYGRSSVRPALPSMRVGRSGSRRGVVLLGVGSGYRERPDAAV